MTPTAIALRCRTPETSTAPPDLAAFAAGARTLDRESADPLLWLLSEVPAANAGGLSARMHTGPVPTPEEYVARAILADPDTASWNFTLRGGKTAQTLAALLLALPLTFAPATAHGEHHGGGHEADESAEEAGEGDAGEGESGEDEAAEGEAAAPAEEAPAEPEAEPLSYEGELLWAAVRGARVEITLRGGTRITGVVLTQSDDELAIARDPDGTVARVPKHMVSRLRVLGMASGYSGGDDYDDERARANKPPPKGDGLAVAGTVLTVTGGTMMLTFGLAHLANSSFFYYGAPLMIVGANLVGPGIPMMIQGLAQQEARKEWEMRNDVVVGVAPTPGGFAGSLRVRF